MAVDLKTLLVVEEDMRRMRDDPDLWNMFVDPAEWQAAHPCECEALCTCDEEEEA